MTQPKHQGSVFTAALICLVLPLLVTVGVWLASPNYRFPSTDVEAQKIVAAPLGGDFLQEYVGGKVWGSKSPADRAKLYDLEWSKSLQHDADVVGFTLEPQSYFPMVYPPFHYAVVSPLARLDYRTASLVWSLLSSLALSISAFGIWKFYPPMRESNVSGWWLAIGLIFVPLLLCINMGQKSTFLLAILTVTYLLLYHRQGFLAGLVFGLIAFKPHLGLLIGLVMLWKQHWSFTAGALLMVGAMVIGTYAIEPNLWRDYYGVVRGMSNYVQTSGYDLAESHSLWGVLELALGRIAKGAVKPLAIALSLGVVTLVGLGFRGRLETQSQRFAIQFSMCIVAMVLLSPHFYTYDLTILLLPMLLTGLAISLRNVESQSEVAKEPTRKQSMPLGLLKFLWPMFFLGAGVFVSIAKQTSIQPSLLLLVAILIVLSQSPISFKTET